MVVLFVITAIVVKPDLGAVLSGFIPHLPSGSLITAMGVIGTTVVPHCFFLHSALCADKWRSEEDKDYALANNNFDVVFSCIAAGLISMAIIITGASLFHSGITVANGGEMAQQLEPLVGGYAKYFFGIGLFAAGITSAIAAPMSCAFAITGICGWSTDHKSGKFRVIMIIVLAMGALVTCTNIKTTDIIVFAQAFNGILLPLSAIILLLAMNNKNILGTHVNNKWQNTFGILIILITIFLSVKTFYSLIG